MDKQDSIHIHTTTHTHTTEYYSAIKKNEILLYETWIDLEGIVLSEISKQKKTNNVWFHLYEKYKKQKSQTPR